MSSHKVRVCLVACAAALLLAVVPSYAGIERLWSELSSSGLASKAETLPDFVELASKLSPAVVNISSEQKAPAAKPGEPSEGEGEGGGTDPFHEFQQPFERFAPRQSKSLGSGFIINKAGYILTNDHVVENGKDVIVTMQSGKEYKAKLIGRDSKSDVALVKIDTAQDLPYAPLGNSDDLKVGEWVMAIGNPFGFDHSVTAGIVSAKGRFIPGNFDDFIQTDASINPGNSGGPLINLRGEVIGVNSAIYTRTGSNMGIGFAIPVNIVKDELDELKASGKVVRGWLGVYIQRVTPDIGESMGLGDARGALVADVLKGGPAKTAGLQRGDVIVSYDNKPITDSQELPLMVGRTQVGRTVKVKIIRNKAAKEVPVTITASREDEIEKASAEQPNPPEGKVVTELGLYVQDLTPKVAQEMGINDKSGVLIAAVRPGSTAEEAGLRKRDVILEVNRQSVKDVDAYQRVVKSAGKGKTVLLLVKRDESTIFVPVKPES